MINKLLLIIEDMEFYSTVELNLHTTKKQQNEKIKN